MRGTLTGETLAEQKLAAFEQLQSEFEASFRFMQEVHGSRVRDLRLSGTGIPCTQ